MLIPKALHSFGFDAVETVSMRQQRFTSVRLFHSYMPGLAPDFSVSFTTTALDRSSIRLFEAPTYMVGSEGPALIFRTARRFRVFIPVPGRSCPRLRNWRRK